MYKRRDGTKIDNFGRENVLFYEFNTYNHTMAIYLNIFYELLTKNRDFFSTAYSKTFIKCFLIEDMIFKIIGFAQWYKLSYQVFV